MLPLDEVEPEEDKSKVRLTADIFKEFCHQLITEKAILVACVSNMATLMTYSTVLMYGPQIFYQSYKDEPES